MGISFANWDAATGPLYMGANSSMEVVWTVIALGLCALVLIVGAACEKAAYRKLNK